MPSVLPVQPAPPSAPPIWLRQAVAATNPDAAHLMWVPLRGGRVNQVWQVGDRVVKLYDPAATSPLFPNDAAAEMAALRAFAPAGFCPALLASGPNWIAYRHIAGPTWTQGVKAVAAMLGHLHTQPLPQQPLFRRLPSGASGILAQGRLILAACRGTLPDPGMVDLPETPDLSVIHGDAVPGNIIMSAKGPVLIDWQCPAIGDPAEDLAAFLSPAMQVLYRGAVLTQDKGAAFLAAYPDPATVARYRALAPLFHWRMAAHCLWKAERGDVDYAQALRLELAALKT